MNRNRKSPASAKTEYTREAVLASLQAALNKHGLLRTRAEPDEGFFTVEYYQELLGVSYETCRKRLAKLALRGGAERQLINTGKTRIAYYKIL